MGCQIFVAMDTTDPLAAQQLAPIASWFATWEQRLSRFRADSELSKLNERMGKGAIKVSGDLWQVVKLALDAAQRSDGLVTPTLLDALERAGYDRDFALIERGVQPMLGGAVGDWRAITCDAVQRTIALPDGMRLDLGGVAKGWAADLTARQLHQTAPTLVDAGGDIAVSGPQTDGGAWPIAIADPFHPDKQLELLMIPCGGVATSGRDYRRWRSGETWLHHIIDPRTGVPAATDLVSVTVIAPSTHEAEVATKTAFILGSDAGLAWLTARPHLAGFLVREDGEQIRTATLNAYCWDERIA